MSKKIRFIYLSICLLLALLARTTAGDGTQAVSAAPVQGTYVVNSTDDVTDGFCNATHCSLREAINISNNVSGVHTITFDLPLPAFILPESELPEITEQIIIDGAAFGSGRCASNASGPSDLDITLSGFNAGTASGLILGPGSDGSTIKGLAIVNYSEFGIEVNSDDNIIRCNHIGVTGDGNFGSGNDRSGLYVTGDRNRIGGDSVDDRNVISDNGGSGIFIQTGSDANIIQNNYIGTNGDGEQFTAIGSGNALNGIAIKGSNNLIGGVEDVKRNVIADNGSDGIHIQDDGAEGNAISSNYIGIDVNSAPLGNEGNGIFVEMGRGTEIGNRASNRIAHNGENGIRIGVDSDDNEILRNRIQQNGLLGIDLQNGNEASGVVTLNDSGDIDSGGNQLQNHPVLLTAEVTGRVYGTMAGVSGHDIRFYFYTNNSCDDSGHGEGRTFQGTVDFVIPAGGFSYFDITLNNPLNAGKQLTAVAYNLDTGNSSEFSNCAQVVEATFVVNSTANTADANHGDGLCDITGASTDCTLRAAINEINGSASDGPFRIEFDIPGAGPHIITPPNDLDPIEKPVTIDGTTQEDAACATPTDTTNLLIVLDGSGMTIGNGLTLASGSGGSEIRGLVVGGFPENGIRVSSDQNIIACNHIGVDVTGRSGFGNGLNGIRITSDNNRIGGTAVSERNVISANGVSGVLLGQGATGNDVKGNYIGTNGAGDAALGNAEAGVRLDSSPGNQVGGRRESAGNLISGNTLYGIQIRADSDNNLIWNNRVGTDQTGQTPLPNGTGIFVRNSDGNELGGDEAAKGNLITGNSGNGILIREDAVNNLIRYNSIAANGGLGIDLNGDGVTPNDVSPDADSGGNHLQNYPSISVANGVAGSVSFELSSAPFTDYVIDVYRAACDSSGYGEGANHLGSGTVTTDAAGTVTATVPLSGLNLGDDITATATDPQGNTSEFSKCVPVTAPNQAVRGDYGDAPDSSNNQGVAPNTAYPGIPGNFPTTYQNTVLGTANQPGPVHFQPVQVHLGAGVSGEDAADAGADQDGPDVNNIVDGGADNADNDGFDDGWLNPTVPFDHCYPTTLEVEVTNNTANAQEMFLNVWFDGNRSGVWGESVNCSGYFGEPVPNPIASEWIVRDAVLTVPPGTSVFPVTTYRVPNSMEDEDHWIRFTLSEVAAGTKDGSSPFGPMPSTAPAGYQFGETEDYLYEPSPIVIEPGEIVVTKSFDPAGPVNPGDIVTVNITVAQNGGSGNVKGQLKDLLPSELIYVRPLALVENGTVKSRGLGYHPSTNRVGWTGELGPNSSIEITFEVEVAACVGGPSVVTNQAEFSPINGSAVTADASLAVNCPVVDPADLTIEKRIKSVRKQGGISDFRVNPNIYLPGTDVVLETIIRNNSGIDLQLDIEEVIDYVSPSGIISGVVPVVINRVETVPVNGEITFESEIVYRDWFNQLRIFDPANRFVSTVTACVDVARNSCFGNSFVLDVVMSDLGDAPASDNHFAVDMEAYSGVTAAFPTVFDSALPGPKIENAQPLKLGRWATYETEADQGPDLVFTSVITDNNIVPIGNLADRESGSDDGFSGNLNVESCETTTLDLVVTIRPQARDYFAAHPDGPNAYLNVWIDGDRNGAWTESGSVMCNGAAASEQVVVNHPIDTVDLFALLPVTVSVTTEAVPWLVDGAEGSEARYMRVMLTDRPVDLDGNGFSNGGSDSDPYAYGEVEDYLINNDFYSTVDEPADGTCDVDDPVPADGEDPARSYYRFVVSYGNLSNVPALESELNLSIDGDDVDLLRVVAINRTENEIIADLDAPCADPANCLLALGQINGNELGRAHVFFSVPAGTAAGDITIAAEVDFPDDPNPANDRDSIIFRPTFLPKPLIETVTLSETAPGLFDVTLSGLSLPDQGLVVGLQKGETVTDTAQADSAGEWSLTFTDLPAGLYRARAAIRAGDVTGPSSRPVPVIVTDQPIITGLAITNSGGQETRINLHNFVSHYDWGRLLSLRPDDYLLEATIVNGTPNTDITLYSASLDFIGILTDPDGDGLFTGELSIGGPTSTRSGTQSGQPLEIVIDADGVSTTYTAVIDVANPARLTEAGTGSAVAGAIVTPWLITDGGLNGRSTTRSTRAGDPSITNFDGEYGLWLVAGTYQLEIEADGYQTYRTATIDHSGGLLSLPVSLSADIADPANHGVLLDENGGTFTVSVAVNEIVEFINGGADGLLLDGQHWDSGLLLTGESFKRRFGTAGSFILTSGDQTVRILVDEEEVSPVSGTPDLYLPFINQ